MRTGDDTRNSDITEDETNPDTTDLSTSIGQLESSLEEANQKIAGLLEQNEKLVNVQVNIRLNQWGNEFIHWPVKTL